MYDAGVEIVLGLFFALSGMVGLIATAWNIRGTIAAARWPITLGRIVATSDEEFWGTTFPDPSAGSPIFSVRYAYEVDGTEYVGDRIGVLDPVWENDSARRARRRFAVGAVVPVRYDSAAPHRAVLRPWAFIGPVAVASVFSAGSLSLGVLILAASLT